MTLSDWLRLFRSQTYPATLALVMVPYLAGAAFLSWKTLALALYAMLLHFLSYGQNSLMDYAMGYDTKDPSKSHHPLATGKISLHVAHNVVHWGLIVLAALGIGLTLVIAASPVCALACLLLLAVCGNSYNSGLSKESIHSWLPISVAWASLAGWGWFLSHDALGIAGYLLVTYFFLVIVFQIGFSGNLKDFAVAGRVEKENLLRWLGATLRPYPRIPGGMFYPGWVASLFTISVKWSSYVLAAVLVYTVPGRLEISRVIWWSFMCVAMIYLLDMLVEERQYIKSRELRNISAMEVVSIYLVIPILLPWSIALVIMGAGIAWFYGMNRALWGTDYPKV